MSAPRAVDASPLAAREGRALLSIASAALALRLLALAVAGVPSGAATGSSWGWGHEAACLARALLERGELADPWCLGSGPSAWLTPTYPALVALAMALGGGVTPLAGLALQLAHALLSAGTAMLLVVAGRRLGLGRAGPCAGWLWALYPPAIWHVARTVWDTTLVAFALTGFLVVLAGSAPRTRSAVRAGLALGALVLVHPAALTLLPASAWWLAQREAGMRRLLRRALELGVPAALVCLPWVLRNQLVLGAPLLRTNLGVALWLGNHEQADGRAVPFREHPSLDAAELERFLALGEVGYDRDCARRALAWIGSAPGRFARLTLLRAMVFWTGSLPDPAQPWEERVEPGGDPGSWWVAGPFLGVALLAACGWFVIAGQPRTRWLLGLALALYPLPYAVTHVSERYRFAVDPLLVLLAACLLVRLLPRRRETTR